MYITEVEISPGVINKLASKHNVSGEEVREVLLYDERLLVYRTGSRRSKRGRRYGKRRYIAYGRTFAGRYLLVVFDLSRLTASVATARDMEPPERRLYERG